ncbi:hypothetical protein LCGC14_1560670 [marine sediment metagenome]|uniref:Uncharacterized protein n=1 Tax=marine sediment metagenome TaxID=412755 RepID=A0A0F9LNB7_9ZZZZ
MKIYSAEKVAKWKAEAQRRKGLSWSIADDWSDNRIINLAISHESLRCQMEMAG